MKHCRRDSQIIHKCIIRHHHIVWALSAMVLLMGARCVESPLEGGRAFGITSPASGTRLLAGDTLSVRWAGTVEDTALDLEWRVADDSVWSPCSIVARGPEGIRVVLPLASSGEFGLRLRDRRSGSETVAAYDLSYYLLEGPFPRRQEYRVGDSLRIAWRLSPAISETLVRLEWEQGRRTGYITNWGSVSRPDTDYVWIIGGRDEETIPYPVTDCQIRVMDYNDPEKSDVSTGFFAVRP